MRANVVLWGTGTSYNEYLSLINLYEMTDQVKVIGIVAKDNYFTEIDGYRVIKNIVDESFDYIICMAPAFYSEIVKEAISLGVEGSKIIRVDVLGRAGFTFDRWSSLYKQRLSIISINCWGGLTYNYFGVPFLSPFINMFEPEEEFISFLEGDIHKAVSNKIIFDKIEYQGDGDFIYPVYQCGGMHLHMNHYHDYLDAENKWYDRVKRINYDNLLVMMYTDSPEIAERFSALKYDKKICFVSFETDFPSCVKALPYTNSKNLNITFWKYVVDMARGKYLLYDPWELLLYGNIVLRGKLF